ncbi:beta strand repeat-containing protein [Dokdonella sp. MW10]|uniref:beta strand repeat-containing protein n=1 Tax=Dokdonella sp. MW10 TaxID=2992926 RepID=UPI003F7FB4DC
MRLPFKPLGLLLASLALASCGGGGGDGGGATSPPANGTITLSATRTTLPLNPTNVGPYIGSPYMAEVAVSFRNAAGTLMAPNGQATMTIAPSTVAAISPPDDPTTTDVNEFTTLMVSFPQILNNGSGTVYVHSGDVAGTATLTVSAVDPNTGRTVSATQTFTIAGATPLPASVAAVANPSVLYVGGTGGATSALVRANVLDGANQPVPDPGAADNVRFEIIGNAGGGVLSSNTGSGSSVTAKTVNGIATVSFQAGTTLPPDNPVQIRVTADRTDNNVSNGIANPVSTTTSIAISDGQLFSLVITSPDVEAITQNLVYDGVDAEGNPVGSPDGTYSFTISALATDRQGNPVAPGTTIQFGVIDAPVTGFPGQGGGTFQIAGSNGNPLEGGTTFTAPTGQFRTAGGGAGPGDTVLVFGQLVTGNADLENIRFVQTVPTQTTLTTTTAFNRNDTTGASVDYGPVLPYVIGRATEVNVTASATTNSLGVATTKINYPVSRLGKQVIVWAQGNAQTSATPKTVGDIQPLRLPGVAPATLTISPTPIAGNRSTQVTACLFDAYQSPILGAYIGFSFSGLGVGTGSIDGTSGSGVIAAPTGLDGCTTGLLVTAGLSSADDDASVVFTAGGQPVEVPIITGTELVLQAFPSTVVAGTGTSSVNLRLSDGAGNGVPNTQLSGTCEAGASITGPIAPTNATGNTTANLSGLGLSVTCPGEERDSAQCTFRTPVNGGPTAVVTVLGVVSGDVCFSPNTCTCPTTPPSTP